MQAKHWIKSGFQAFGLDLVRHVPPLSRPFEVLPLVVESHLRRHDNFFFLQVGANDGALDDPIRELILKHDLPGLMVEPLPDMFERLQANFAEQTRLIYENVAITADPGTVKIYRVAADASGPEHWHGMASLSRDHLISEGAPEALVRECVVEATTMRALLDKHRIGQVDLLQVDTEGYDFEILKFALQCGLRPSIINYEHCHLVPKVRHAAQRALVDLGYRFLEVGKDTLALRDPLA